MPYKVSSPIIVYKSATTSYTRVIVRLRIPRGALTCKPLSRYYRDKNNKMWVKRRKNRASQARVLSITGKHTGKRFKTAYSHYSSMFEYTVGEVVRPMLPFDRSTRECASGIHFFERRRSAKEWP